jgi:Na+-translocating ferredoxin:NAD+ oxidoreductase subunit D
MSDQAIPIFTVSSAPHAHSGASVRGIMLDVIIAMIPAMLAATYFFGWQAVRLLLVCTLGCVGTEAACRKLMGRNLAIDDLSAAVTGILLAFNLPPSIPTLQALFGCIIAIAIAKQVFGGIGYNPFNPALIARVALLVSFPASMTRWHSPLNPARWLSLNWVDAATTATPLDLAKTALAAGNPLPFDWNASMAMRFLVGNMDGCIGEVSALALLLGAAYMLWRRCISWHIPGTYLATAAVFAGILHLANPSANMPVSFHLLAGGLMLGSLFMATDMTTSPLTKRGQIIYGIGCGFLTILIRRWGGYPEGVSFAILLMNAITPLINQYTQPGVYGHKA